MTVPDIHFLGHERTCLCEERRHVLSTILRDTNALTGEVWECGVYRGGTTLLIKAALLGLESSRLIRAFDTFTGMPVSGPQDTHLVGSFSETSLEEVTALFAPLGIVIHAGRMPATFVGLEDRLISVAHIDVDQYESVLECLRFIYPRVQTGGAVILDDYNCPGCLGAKAAVDEYMADKPERAKMHETGGTPQVWFEKL